MTTHDVDHSGAHGDAEVHLPDPSIWPLVVGFACALLGASLIFWSRDRENDWAGFVLGFAFFVVLLSAAGWASQDWIMRRKAAQGAHAESGRNPRYNQVVTFAIPEGEFANARGVDGVLTAIEQSDLRDLAGFQDLRVQVSPAAIGPSQVLVETTWSGRDDLASYDATRQSLLDTIAARDTQVVPGSLQVFDMEVVRDTKDTSFRFGLGAAASVFGALIVGGFMVGAGLTAFQSESTAVEGGGGGTPAPAEDPYRVVATDNKFDKETLQAPPNTEVTFTFVNNGRTKHNLHFTTAEGGDTLAEGAMGEILDGGASEQITFTTPGEGSYYFLCDLHPTEMNGTFQVTASAPPPGGAPAGGGGGEQGGATLTATDNKFDKNELTASAGQPFTVTLENKGRVPHNVSFYTNESASQLLAPEAEGEILQGGKSETLTFTPPNAGSFYFQCDLHPTEMKGTFVVQ